MRHQSDCRERNRNNCCILYSYLYYLNFSIVWLIELASYRPDPNVCLYTVMLCLLFSTCFLISEIAECIFPPPFKSLGLWNVETWDELERFAQTRDRSLCWVLQCKVQSAKFGLDFLLPSPFYRCFHHHHHRRHRHHHHQGSWAQCPLVSSACLTIWLHSVLSAAFTLSVGRSLLHQSSTSSVHLLPGFPLLCDPFIISNTTCSNNLSYGMTKEIQLFLYNH